MKNHLKFILVTIVYFVIFLIAVLILLITFRFTKLFNVKNALGEITEYAKKQIYGTKN